MTTARPLRQSTNDAQKRTLRAALLALLPEPARVLETHAGDGSLSSLYATAAQHLAIDSNKAFKNAVNLDSRLALRAINLDTYNFFDIDAYGNPLEWVWLVSQRRGVITPMITPFALVITSGFCCGAHRTRKTLYDAGFSQQMLDACQAKPKDRFSGVWQEETMLAFFKACLFAWFPSFRLAHFEAHAGYKPKTKNDLICYYIGAYFEPKLPGELARNGPQL